MSNSYNANIKGALITKFLAGELTQEEHLELEQWLDASSGNRKKFEEVTNAELLFKKLDVLEKINDKEQQVWGKIEQALKRGMLFTLITNPWVKLAVAVVLIIGFTGTWFWLQPGKNKNAPVITEGGLVADVAPGRYKAKLTLANGSSIFFDTTSVEKIPQQGSSRILSEHGQITYQKLDDFRSSGNINNTLSTPAGGFYNIRLPDGTFVALNVSSSLTYPTSFTGNERVVELKGEAYFDVAKDPRKPFKVVLQDGTIVNVVGTNFNIKDYDNEPASKITLLEGRIAIAHDSEEKRLQPGQQAIIADNKDIVVKNSVDTLSVLGWKHGYFNSEEVSIHELLREIERWYNVKIIYQQNIEDFPLRIHFSRNTPVRTLLKVLEETGKIKFTINQTNITAAPN
jgi:transmembrane sensor